MAGPLYQLTKKVATWEWFKYVEGAFNQSRDKLVNEPVMLALPDWGKNFLVETDASSNGIASPHLSVHR